MSRDLEGRVALITGGGRGIGREITLHLAARGANVVVCYLRQRGPAEETCRLAESHAVKATPIRANVGEAAHIDSSTRSTRRTATSMYSSRTRRRGSSEDSTSSTRRRGRGRWTRTRADCSSVRTGRSTDAAGFEHRGAVEQRFPARPAHMLVGTSKAALEALCRYLAVELAPRGINVNVVAPGVVETMRYAISPSATSWLPRPRSGRRQVV